MRAPGVIPDEENMNPSDILKKAYTRCVTPTEDGSFHAEIAEFPGCIAVGDTAILAIASLEEVAEAWLTSALARGLKIPPPRSQHGNDR
jgi:predicted RNase H-like HicB family nuclease